jgi:hypothetical protein
MNFASAISSCLVFAKDMNDSVQMTTANVQFFFINVKNANVCATRLWGIHFSHEM